MLKVLSGIDLVKISRLASLRPELYQRFLRRVLTGKERSGSDRLEHIAGLVAAKEAVAKTLQCGIGYIGWQSVEIVPADLGSPTLTLHGRALSHSQQLGITSWSVSITHEGEYAAAVAIALCEQPDAP